MRLLKVSSLPGMWLGQAAGCRPTGQRDAHSSGTGKMARERERFLQYTGDGIHVSLVSATSDAWIYEHVSLLCRKERMAEQE